MSDTNSPHADELLLVGTVVNTVGLRGEVRMHFVSTQIEHLAQHKPMLYSADGQRSFRLKRIAHYKNDLYTVGLGGIATRDLAEAIRGTELYIKVSDTAPLDQDEYFIHDLLGLTVETTTGTVIGTVRDVITTGASDIIVINRAGQDDALVPMVKEFIVALDVAQRRIQIRLMPGLIEGLDDTPSA